MSVAALLAASGPPIYFAVRLRGQDGPFVGLSVLFAAALLVHGLFHLLEFLGRPAIEVLAVEAVSAALILGFAVAYRVMKGRRSP